MKTETIYNLVWLVAWAILGVSALFGVVICGAWWHLFTAGACFAFVALFWIDNAYGVVSVKQYFTRRAKAKSNK